MGFLLVFIKHFFARCYGWGARGVYHLKIGDFALTGAGLPKISRRRGRPHQPLFFSVWYNNLDNLILSKENAFDRKTGGRTAGQTDRQTDRILIARPRQHSVQRGENEWVNDLTTIRQKWRPWCHFFILPRLLVRHFVPVLSSLRWSIDFNCTSGDALTRKFITKVRKTLAKPRCITKLSRNRRGSTLWRYVTLILDDRLRDCNKPSRARPGDTWENTLLIDAIH